MASADRPAPLGLGDRPAAIVRVEVERWRSDPVGWQTAVPDEVVAEEPLEIRLSARDPVAVPVYVTLRTPGHDFELAAGFVLSEGIASRPTDIRGLRYCTRPEEEQWFNVVDVDLGPDVPVNAEEVRRATWTNSACGLCGSTALERLRRRNLPPLAMGPTRSAEEVARWGEALRAHQTVFARTGGLHATGMIGPNGTLRFVREDVGRHNAFDKATGRLALDRVWPASSWAAVVSGRASYELVQKAIVAGLPIVAAVGAPSHLAVALARSFGLTLIGFLRPTGFNVYSAPERLGLPTAR